MGKIVRYATLKLVDVRRKFVNWINPVSSQSLTNGNVTNKSHRQECKTAFLFHVGFEK